MAGPRNRGRQGRPGGPGHGASRGGPDRRGGGLGAQGQLTRKQKERIAESQAQKNYDRATGWQGAGGFLTNQGEIVRSNLQVQRENERLAKIAAEQAAKAAAELEQQKFHERMEAERLKKKVEETRKAALEAEKIEMDRQEQLQREMEREAQIRKEKEIMDRVAEEAKVAREQMAAEK